MGFRIQNGVLEKYTEEQGVTEVVIPEGVTKIKWCAFDGCTSLTSITIPESVTEIGENAFYGCTSLTSITIPEGVTKIRENAFCGCTGLTSITIPQGVTEIGVSAFRRCTGLTSITIPEGVTKIGMVAFEDCTSLTSITIPESVTKIELWAFRGCTKLKGCCLDTVPITEDLYGYYKGFTLQWDEKTEYNKQVELIDERDYAMKMNHNVKYSVLWQMFAMTPDDPELFAYIKKNFTKMFPYAIDNGYVDAVKAVCENGKLLTKRNIDKFIDYTMESIQSDETNKEQKIAVQMELTIYREKK